MVTWPAGAHGEIRGTCLRGLGTACWLHQMPEHSHARLSCRTSCRSGLQRVHCSDRPSGCSTCAVLALVRRSSWCRLASSPKLGSSVVLHAGRACKDLMAVDYRQSAARAQCWRWCADPPGAAWHPPTAPSRLPPAARRQWRPWTRIPRRGTQCSTRTGRPASSWVGDACWCGLQARKPGGEGALCMGFKVGRSGTVAAAVAAHAINVCAACSRLSLHSS